MHHEQEEGEQPNMNRIALCIVGAAVLVLGLGARAYAQGTEPPLTAREKALLEKVEALEKRVGELEKKAAEAPKPAATPAPDAKTLEGRVDKIEKDMQEEAKKEEKKPANQLTTFWNQGLRLESADGRFKLKIGGRVFTDAAFFNQSQEFQDSSVFDEQDGAEFRAARINMQGTMYDNINYRAEYDFAGTDDGQAKFYDVYMGMSGIPGIGNVRVGHFREPYGLERLTSISDITFLERALPNAFAPARNLGVMAFNTQLDKRLSLAVGAFKEVDSFPSKNDADEDQGYSITARVTGLPWYADEGRKLLHLGVAYSHRNPDGAVLGYRSTPEAHLGDTFLNTERFQRFRFADARMNNVDLWGGEAALEIGPFSLQGEYMLSDVETDFAGDVALDGYYVQASYFLTGENRPYDQAQAVFGRIKPRHDFSLKGDKKGWGAWELALRYSNLDLNDGPIIRGGEETNWTAGVNWYLNPNTRIMWNYTYADIEHDLFDGDLGIFQMRFQVDF